MRNLREIILANADYWISKAKEAKTIYVYRLAMVHAMQCFIELGMHHHVLAIKFALEGV